MFMIAGLYHVLMELGFRDTVPDAIILQKHCLSFVMTIERLHYHSQVTSDNTTALIKESSATSSK